MIIDKLINVKFKEIIVKELLCMDEDMLKIFDSFNDYLFLGFLANSLDKYIKMNYLMEHE